VVSLARSDIDLVVGTTGRWHDPDTGLIDFRARWFSPELGRFIYYRLEPAPFSHG